MIDRRSALHLGATALLAWAALASPSTLAQQKDLALLFRDLATLRVDPSLLEDVASLRWQGPAREFAALCRRLGADDLRRRADALASKR